MHATGNLCLAPLPLWSFLRALPSPSALLTIPNRPPPLKPQDALHALLGRCLHLAALALPARELPSSCPLGAAEQRAPAELVAARLSRLPGAWALQQLPCSLTELSLTHCGWGDSDRGGKLRVMEGGMGFGGKVWVVEGGA